MQRHLRRHAAFYTKMYVHTSTLCNERAALNILPENGYPVIDLPEAVLFVQPT